MHYKQVVFTLRHNASLCRFHNANCEIVLLNIGSKDKLIDRLKTLIIYLKKQVFFSISRELSLKKTTQFLR